MKKIKLKFKRIFNKSQFLFQTKNKTFNFSFFISLGKPSSSIFLSQITVHFVFILS